MNEASDEQPASPAVAPPCPAPETPSDTATRVVAVGASAGGLEALEQLFSALPDDLGVAFVVIQHLPPDHKSMMAELLGRYTRMPVRLVQDGVALVANTVYLIPPAMLMTISGEQLRLVHKPPHILSLPIDAFFSSLARERGAQAAAVILSGTGSDGSRGGVDIQRAGGLVLVQDPLSARFDGMPRSAISAGLTQAVLAPEPLAQRLSDYLGHSERRASTLWPPAQKPASAGPLWTPGTEPRQLSGEEATRSGSALSEELAAEAAGEGELTGFPVPEPELMAGVYSLLNSASGIDFQDYKPGTISRRLARRMAVRGISRLQDYLALLHNEREELAALRRELLIPVTQFFRDSEAFELLRTQVVEPLVAQRETGHAIRIWCAGVATGEEAYSVAALFLDAFEAARKWPVLKVFATDVDPDTVETASRGRYDPAAVADIPPAMLGRHFEVTPGALLVRPALRQCVVFARHDLLNDPPFTRMDLVICRNTLIYFGLDAQRRVLRRLQYALVPRGCLFLGKSESLGELETDFQVMERAQKLWRLLRPAPHNISRTYPTPAVSPVQRLRMRANQREKEWGDDTGDVGQAVLRNAYAPPPAVLLNDRQEIVHAYGQVGRYLLMRPGQASLELARLLPEKLAPYAAALLHKTAREGVPARSELVHVPYPAEDAAEVGAEIVRTVRLAAWPVQMPGEARSTLLAFEAASTTAAEGPAAPPAMDVSAETAERMAMLEGELALTRENLQSTIEDLETSNEELQATNEELMASNEELQSTNEELQSVNEELNTINAEYHEKIEVLDRVNADLDSLTRVAAAGAIFVDDGLHLSRFSPDAPKLFRIREQDIGRPIADLAHDFKAPELFDDLRRCVQESVMVEREVSASGGRQYLVKMLPYQVPSSARRAAVLSFVETTHMHQATELQAVLDALAEHVAVLDKQGRIRMVNAAWRRFAQDNGDVVQNLCGLGADYLAVCQAAEGSAEEHQGSRAAEGLRAVLEGRLQSFSMEYPCHSPQQQRWFAMHVRPLDGYGAVVSHVDITPWVDGERQ